MPIIKCKMCGGDMALSADKSVGTCEYCGSTMTIPKLDDDQRAAAFDRGNHFRRIGEFDKALSVYERIVQEDDGDAEAHWCCALCRFGIEYVKDPTSGEYLPTCHRASFDSFLEDVDYQAALSHADAVAKTHYQADGEKIAAVQRGILSISQKEQPFDVFICYKESDDHGQRTVDSTLAQDIYYQLTEQGRRVFFARITLEDKAGQEYEPYIFAALHSAKVMVVVGTKPEYLNAVWVKNEWSRYLALMKTDRKRLLIPCFRDMDPYDLPEQLSVLQSYDMGKIGFIQDLIRGIAKVLDADKPKVEAVKETAVASSEGGGNMQALLKRGYMALEDGEWDKADDFFEQVLNLDAECAEAYFGKLLAQKRCANMEAFRKKRIAWDADTEELTPYEKDRMDRVRKAQQKYTVPKYFTSDEAVAHFNFSKTAKSQVHSYEEALEQAKTFWKNDKLITRAMRFASGDFAQQFTEAREAELAHFQTKLERAKQGEKASVDAVMAEYAKAMEAAEQAVASKSEKAKTKKAADEEKAKKEAEVIQRQKEFEAAEAAKRKAKNKKIAKITGIVAAIAFVVGAAGFFLTTKVIIPGIQYHAAEELLAQGNYVRATAAFLALGNYKDSAERIKEASYLRAESMLAAGDKEAAAMEFGRLGEFQDAKERSYALWEQIAQRGTIAAGDSHTVGLKADGTVVATGTNVNRQCNVSDWTGIMAVAAGDYHTVGLKADGTVVATGRNDDGRCDVSGWSDIVAVAAGSFHTVGLKADGTVVAIGNNASGQCAVSRWSDIVAVAAGGSHTVGLKEDGTVVAAGNNEDGQCEVSDWSNIVAVAAGNNHTVGLKADGTAMTMRARISTRRMTTDGLNSRTIESQYRVVERVEFNWSNLKTVVAGSSYTIGLKTDGTVVCTGDSAYGCNVSTWLDIVAVAAGDGHTVGLKSNGTVVATGQNGSGQCDVSGWTNIKVPTQK